MKNIPNYLSISRLSLSILCLFWFLIYPFSMNFIVLIYTILAFTDFLDGFIARKFNCTSKFGEVADMFGDRIMNYSLFMILIVSNSDFKILSGLCFLLLLRDFTYSYGRMLFDQKKMGLSKMHDKLALCFVIVGLLLFAMFSSVHLLLLGVCYSYTNIILALASIYKKNLIKKQYERKIYCN